jgi:hypothetical protein
MPNKLKLALKVGATISPIVLALAANYFYDIRPLVHDVCEALLPFGSLNPPVVISPESKDAG